MVGLKNSETEVAGVPVEFGTHLNRPYYVGIDDCKLCKIGYPRRPVTSPSDLRQLGDVNAYDFWEMVHETRSLEFGHKVAPNGINHYLVWINTDKVIARYDRYIAAVLAAQLKAALGESPINRIACPIEYGALRLAYSLAYLFRTIIAERYWSAARTCIQQYSCWRE